jgi:hypothetical protein
MAEIYPPGKNRIFYRATSFKIGLTVTADIIDPDLCSDCSIALTEVVDVKGLYYFDYTFRVGPYIVYFYENGVETWSQAYSIRKDSKGFRASPGSNVINT